MAFISDKWRDSSVLTKAASFTMALNTLFTFISNIPMIAYSVGAGAVSGSTGTGIIGALIWFLFTAGIQALLTFGIFKVSRAARTFTILEGLGSVLIVITLIATWKAGSSASGGLMGILAGIIWAIIPASAKAIMGIFVMPYVLQILSMLLLFGCGKDFAKGEREAM